MREDHAPVKRKWSIVIKILLFFGIVSIVLGRDFSIEMARVTFIG